MTPKAEGEEEVVELTIGDETYTRIFEWHAGNVATSGDYTWIILNSWNYPWFAWRTREPAEPLSAATTCGIPSCGQPTPIRL